MQYPPAPRLPLVDDLHGTAVPDPYRWLEDAARPRRIAWSAAQDELARPYLDGLPGRARWRRRSAACSAPAPSAPRCTAATGVVLLAPRSGDQQHAVLERPGRRRRPTASLLDPAALDPSGLTTLDAWSPSRDGRLLAYQLSSGGDEESVLHVLDVDTGEHGRGAAGPHALLVGGLAARRRAASTTCAACPRTAPSTAGCTCTASGRTTERRRTSTSSARAATRAPTTASRSPGTAAGWSSRPASGPSRATTSGSPTSRPGPAAGERCASSRRGRRALLGGRRLRRPALRLDRPGRARAAGSASPTRRHPTDWTDLVPRGPGGGARRLRRSPRTPSWSPGPGTRCPSSASSTGTTGGAPAGADAARPGHGDQR